MTNARLLRRFAAILYDTLLVAALMVLVTIVFIAFRGGENVLSGGPTYVLLYNIVRALVVFVFFVGFWAGKGRTLGMQSWGLQLQTEDGKVPCARTASIRFFAAILSWLPLGLGFFWQLWDSERLTWHDRLSKTRLVYYPRQKPDDQAYSLPP